MRTLILAVLAAGAGLLYQAPPDWERVESGSAMRMAEWKLAPAAADPEEARVIIFYFGTGQGGGVDANLERWYGQFEQPDGSNSREKAAVRRFKLGQLRLTRADLSGTYVAPVSPGSSRRHHKPGLRMIAAIVEGPGGPWFIRLLGPGATVARWEKSFDAFLQSLKAGE